MKYLDEEIEFEDLQFLREKLHNIIETLENGAPAYLYYKKVHDEVIDLKNELEKDIREIESDLIENNICPECGGNIIPQVVYKGRGIDTFDPNYWPDEYENICEDCGENYG